MSEKKEPVKVPVKDLEANKDPMGGRGKPTQVVDPSLRGGKKPTSGIE